MQSAQNPFPVAEEVPRLHSHTSGQTVTEYATKGRKFVSIVQLLLGVVSLLCGVLISVILLPASTYCDGFHKTYVGIWCGVVFIVTGVIGEYSTKKQFLLTLYLAFGIFTCVVSAAGIVVSSAAIPACTWYHNEEHEAMKALYTILIVVFVLVMLSSIVGASFSCNGWEWSKQAPTVIYYNCSGAQTGPPMDSATLTIPQNEQMGTHDYSTVPNDPVSQNVDKYFTVVQDQSYSQKVYQQ